MEESRILRGEVYLEDASRHGGLLKKVRPVVVVQNDIGNSYAAHIIVAVIRDPHGGRMLPVFVPVAKGTGGLSKDSVVDAGHLNTIRREALFRCLGMMPPEVMAAIDRALHLSLGLKR